MRIESECSHEIVVSYMREEMNVTGNALFIKWKKNIYVRGNNAISYMDIKIKKKFKLFLQNILTNESKYGIICIVEQWIYKVLYILNKLLEGKLRKNVYSIRITQYLIWIKE